MNTDTEKPAIVIDNGTGRIKAGFAGDESPALVFQSLTGVPRTGEGGRMITADVLKNLYIGDDAFSRRGRLRLRRPLEHGVITDWNDMEAIWNWTFDHLEVDPSEQPVLLTEAPLNPRANREKAATLMFEAFNVPAYYVSLQAVLSLYSTGRVTGTVLDSGDGVTHCVPVFEGYAMNHAIQRSDVAGRDVTEYLSRILREQGHAFVGPNHQEIVRDIKEKCCFVRDSSDETPKTSERTYELPDGSIIAIGDQCHRAPEILFDPSPIGVESPGMHKMIASAIGKCDIDTRRSLYDNIVISGGTTLFPGMVSRLENELRALAPSAMKPRVVAPNERAYSVWIGGSTLATLQTFQQMWVTKEEYEEYGPGIVHKKCF